MPTVVTEENEKCQGVITVEGVLGRPGSSFVFLIRLDELKTDPGTRFCKCFGQKSSECPGF